MAVLKTLSPNHAADLWDALRTSEKMCEVTPLSKSTLRRVLSAYSAPVRKSLQGLDYFISDGEKAFDDLLKLVDQLIDFGIQSNVAQDLQKKA